MPAVLDKFLRYVRIDTQSDPSSLSTPSAQKEFDLARLLVSELESLGLKDITLDEHCIVMAALPANTAKKLPVIGFLAHMDTSPDMSGANVNPRLVENYGGGDIVLNRDLNIVLSPAQFPELRDHLGHTLVVTDGTTLLGADDKAGVAEIMTALEYLVQHPEIEHGMIKVAFTPDEEVGRGVEAFDVQKFGADFAYTLDGAELGGIEYENFNAAGARVTVKGRSVHPGSSKNKMINSILIAMEFNDLLPVEQRPMYTEGYEGFFHLYQFNGSIEESTLTYIIRDHDKAKFEAKKALMQRSADFINQKYGPGALTLELRDQYFNMRTLIEPVIHIVDTAKEAMRQLGIEPVVVPIRGGTDGAMLSYKGLPTPNLFTGGMNYHGKFEYASVEVMQKAVEVVVKIIQLYAQK
jgi:tripeptide aminopeptidase